MFEILRERVFSASHQLRGYKGKCERLHGHNWRVHIHLAAADLDQHGMVIDFHQLDTIMAEAIAPFEHQHLNDIPPFDVINPSAENVAFVLSKRVMEQLRENKRVRIIACDVWENDLSKARYVP
jgi:6-pyruvoyltetrahydropterin/6-carboxytetrahydropterin synthase